MENSLKPTIEAYQELEQAFDFFNAELFENRLPGTLITLQRQHDSYGYFSANQFSSLKRKREFSHEIALNPNYFAVRSIPETLSVLVREMVTLDLLLHGQGKPPRRRYRNKEWAEAVEAIGLMPTDTGKPGGKTTGDNVQTYIIEGGRFDVASAKLIDKEFQLSWADRYVTEMPELLAPLPGKIIPEPSEIERQDARKPQLDPEIAEAMDELMRDDGSDHGHIAIDDHPLATSAHVQTASKQQPGEQGPSDAPRMKVFEHARSEELAELGIEARPTVKSVSKRKFQCPKCKVNAWGRPALRLACMGTAKRPHDSELMVGEGADPAPENPEGEMESEMR